MNNFEKLSALLTFAMLMVVVSSTIWKDYRLESEGRSYATGKPTCTAPGPICHGCKDVYTCDDKNIPTKIWTCKSNQTCSNGKCVTTPNFECSEQGQLEFPCQMEGLFPDPGNCFKYHICVAEDDSYGSDIKSHDERTCKNLYSYNARTGYCDKKMNNTTCQSFPVPLCIEPGVSGALKDNPSIYYTCQEYVPKIAYDDPAETSTTPPGEKEAVLYPHLKICENGKQYDATKYSCK